MNLLLFNLAVDQKHVTLAFCLKWIEKLADQFEHIDVVTMYKGEYTLPQNVTVWSIGKEKGYPEFIRAIKFYLIVLKIYLRRKPRIVFCHMIPIFAILFWPIAKLTNTRIVMWYAHGSTPQTLKLAHKLVDMVVSSTKEGFRLASNKLKVIGQGIDLGLFPFQDRVFVKPLSVITVGRVAPSKNTDKIIKSLNIWSDKYNQSYSLTIVGEGTTDKEQEYLNYVKALSLKAKPTNKITFTGRLAPSEIKSYLSKSQLFISLGATGSLDKAIVEAMATGCIVISSNDAFGSIAKSQGFHELIIECEEDSIADGINNFYEATAEQKAQLSKTQSDYAIQNHSLDGLVTKLSNLLKNEVE